MALKLLKILPKIAFVFTNASPSIQSDVLRSK